MDCIEPNGIPFEDPKHHVIGFSSDIHREVVRFKLGQYKFC